MNRRAFSIFIVLTLAVIGVALWILNYRLKSHSRPDPSWATRTGDSVTPMPSLQATVTPAPNSKEQQEDRRRSMLVAIENANVPITFFGKIVDQRGDPVPAVSVKFSYSVEHGNPIGVPWSDTTVVKGEIASGTNGMFSIGELRGSSLHIESLDKEGFQHNPRGAIVFNYFGHTASGKFVPDRDKPVLFVMTNKASAERLVANGGPFGKTMRLPGDGTPLRWNIWRGQPDQSGELEIRLKRDPVVLARVGQAVTWSAKVAIIGGGIVEAPPEELFYQAPSEGYASELDYPKIEQKHGVSARSFYVRTADGKHGRIELDLFADDEGPTARCLIKVLMNPSGSRNLEGIPTRTSR